jgi:short-subunit dehydrogenase
VNPEKWAFITGASSGIGEAFARKLAERGYNLIITARRKELLEQLSAELTDRHHVEVQVVVADLAKENDLQKTESHLKRKKDLEILINNAGYGIHSAFTKVEPKRWHEMIYVHILASTRLCHAALTIMKPRNKGYIINVSSVAALIPVAGVVYTGTKSYLNNFSRLLQQELRPTGIKIQALCPGFTHSGFHDTDEYENWERSTVPAPFWMTTERVVDTSLKALSRKKVVVVPGFLNRILVRFSRIMVLLSRIILPRRE